MWTQLKKKEACDTVMIMKYVNTVGKKRSLLYCDNYEICEHSWKKEACDTVMIMKYVNTVEKKRSLWYCDNYEICEHSWQKKRSLLYCDDYEICEHSWKKKETYDTVMIMKYVNTVEKKKIMLDVLNWPH